MTPEQRRRIVWSTFSLIRVGNGASTKAKSESRPFFKPWMPHPMEKSEYQAWFAHLDAHPDEKAEVIKAMERDDRMRR